MTGDNPQPPILGALPKTYDILPVQAVGQNQPVGADFYNLPYSVASPEVFHEIGLAEPPQPPDEQAQGVGVDVPLIIVGVVAGYAAAHVNLYIWRKSKPAIAQYARRAYGGVIKTWRKAKPSPITDAQIASLLQRHLKIDEVAAWEIVSNTYKEIDNNKEAQRHGADYTRQLFFQEIRESYLGGIREVWIVDKTPVRRIQVLLSKIAAFMGR